MLDLPEDWVWDFWCCRDDDGRHHAFFLKAPRSLGDPDLRHWHATAGHAVSDDLVTWTRLPDALDPQPVPAFDDAAIWTGCVVRAPEGDWRMFTTGLSADGDMRVQRIGVATSADLVTWQRSPAASVQADPRWYATVETGARETPWRDPFVLRAADGWHLLATAQDVQTGGAVIAHAVSRDLATWSVRAPITQPSKRFGHAEVVSVAVVEDRPVLLFSCLSDRMAHDPEGAGGVWALPLPALDELLDGGPETMLDLDRAVRVTSEDLYVGRLVPGDDGLRFLAFHHRDEHGAFVGGIIDPLEVAWLPDGSGLRLVGALPRWLPSEQRQ
ncbi:MAG: hypothetical protein ACTHNS_03075 [Marmoricola sp.]